jgi:hypothetical protein
LAANEVAVLDVQAPRSDAAEPAASIRIAGEADNHNDPWLSGEMLEKVFG